MNDTLEVFHYTGEKGYHGIKRDGFIKASVGKRAKFGKGVYLTSVKPNEDRKDVATVIFAGGGDSMYKVGRLDHYIRVKIPSHRLEQKRENVFMLTVNKLILNEFEWDGGENRSWGKLLPLGFLVCALSL